MRPLNGAPVIASKVVEAIVQKFIEDMTDQSIATVIAFAECGVQGDCVLASNCPQHIAKMLLVNSAAALGSVTIEPDAPVVML